VIDRLALNTLGRHVGDGSQNHPRLGHELGLLGLVSRLRQLGETEVQHLDPAVVSDHHVGRFEVAMDDPFLVGGGQRVSDLDRERKEPVELEASGWQHLIEALALDQLHRQEMDPVGLLHRVDGDDVRLVEGRDRLRLALESLQPLCIRRHLGRQHLDRHLAVERRVGRLPHLAHASFAQLGGDRVVRERSADHEVPVARGRGILEEGSRSRACRMTALRPARAIRLTPKALGSRSSPGSARS
jgi:hypothetical protein